MSQINFNTTFGKNEGLIMSPSSLLEKYFHGISICTKDGKRIPEDTIKQKILAAQRMVETSMSIKLQRTVVSETRDFLKQEYDYWGFMQVTYPVAQVLELTGFLGLTKQTEYPLEWTSTFEESEQDLLRRTIHIVPAGAVTAQTNSIIFVGITPNAGFYGVPSIPNYWTIKYCTGFERVPAELFDLVGKIASIQLFAITGDIVLGSGIASQSLGLDGLSQSIQTTQSAENSAHSARIRQYQSELKVDIPRLVNYYKGISFMVC